MPRNSLPPGITYDDVKSSLLDAARNCMGSDKYRVIYMSDSITTVLISNYRSGEDVGFRLDGTWQRFSCNGVPVVFPAEMAADFATRFGAVDSDSESVQPVRPGGSGLPPTPPTPDPVPDIYRDRRATVGGTGWTAVHEGSPGPYIMDFPPAEAARYLASYRAAQADGGRQRTLGSDVPSWAGTVGSAAHNFG